MYVFAGQRGKEYLSDLFTYEVDTHQIEYINLNEFGTKDSSHVPAAGYTQRATIDPELGEIYVLSVCVTRSLTRDRLRISIRTGTTCFQGLSKDKDKRDDNVQNSFWVYNIQSGKWTCIYRNENAGEKYWSKMQDYEPCPRFAHQIVYDHTRKVNKA